MRSILAVLIAAALGGGLFACSSFDDGGVVVNFEETVQIRQNLMFTFDEPMRPDSSLNIWDTTALISFTPHVAGKFKWISPNQLVFSPSLGYAPATSYTAELLPELLQGANGASVPQRDVFEFHTPWQTITETTAMWAKNTESGAIEAQITVSLLYATDPSTLGERLHILRDNNEVPFRAEQRGVGTSFVVSVPASALPGDGTGLVLVIDKGLPIVDTRVATTSELKATVVVPSRKELAIVDIMPAWEGNDGVVHVKTTQAIEESTLQKAIRISPEVSFTTELSSTGFVVRGPFDANRMYIITIDTTLRGVVGGVLSDIVSRELEFGELEPSIAFANPKAMYLGSQGSRTVGIKITNVPTVRISVFRVYENNILHFLRQGREYAWWGDDMASPAFDFRYVGLSDYADTVSTQVVATRDLGSVERGVVGFTFDVRRQTSRKGLYLVKVESTDQQWIQASTLVSLTDIGLIVKQGQSSWTAFVTSIADAQPKSAVELSLISTNNQVIKTVTTGADGVAHLDDLPSILGNFRVGMVTASYGDDYTVIVMKDTRVDHSRFDVGGAKDAGIGLQAFVYGERDIYRPGETIHLNTIVRDALWKAVPGAPVTLRVLQPNGREYRRLRLTPDNQGAVSCDVPLHRDALTGTYRCEVLGANDVLLGQEDIAVEEFLPDKVKVQLGVSDDVLRPGQTTTLSISGMSFFGAPAGGHSYEVTLRITPESFSAQRYPNFTFDVVRDERRQLTSTTRTGVLDESGNATEEFVIDSTLYGTGLLDAVFYVTVFDDGGRAVYRTIDRPVHTQPVMFGIGTIDRYLNVRSAVNIPILATTYDGSVSQGVTHLRIVKREWHSVMERSYDNGYRWVSQKREVVLVDKELRIEGDRYTYSWTPPMSGDYEIRVGAQGADAHVAYSVWAWSWGSTDVSSFSVNTEGFIDIELDKESYQPGESANVLLKTPFAGRILVTVERDGVLDHHVVTTEGRSATLSLAVAEDWLPNVYISATLIKPHKKSDMPLTVAHGYAPLHVLQPKRRLPVTIDVQSSVRSTTKQTIKVSTTPGAFVTIAVVDEGILQIRNMTTPDPHGYFYRRRALQTESYDVFPFLYPELSVTRMAYGAGDDEGIGYGRRLNPILTRRTETDLVSIWSGILPTQGGQATMTIDIPAFAGALRVMAVVWKDEAFGSAEKSMSVADPVVLDIGAPRAMSPGDSLIVPVIVTNTTKKSGSITTNLKVDGPVRVVGASSRSVTVDPSRDMVVDYTIVATGALGVATIEAEAKGLGEVQRRTTSVPVRPMSPLTESSEWGSVTAGKTNVVNIGNGFYPGTSTANLVVTSFPAPNVLKGLDNLLGYPYGCVEQTISKAFPQIYLADLSKVWNERLGRSADPVKNVREAVRKVESMQSYNGGVSYWPGGTDVSWWGTAYAVHFLSEAQKAGYDVDKKVQQKMLDYLERRAKARETEGMRVPSGDGYTIRSVAAREVFYSLFVLASMGRQDVPTMNYYRSSPDVLSQDSRYVLACTYLMLGDRATYDKLVPKTFASEKYRPFDGGSFASPRRDLAFALLAMVQAAPNDPKTAELAKRLSDAMRGGEVWSTQENAFAVLALGKLANKQMKAGVTCTVTENGKKIATLNGAATSVSVTAGRSYSVSANGGTVYWFWSAEGIPTSPRTTTEDVVLKVRRQWLTRDGKPLTSGAVRQNDIIIVKVTVMSTDRVPVRNVVISDVLPGGCELENPRLGAMDNAKFAADGAIATYYDYRDDRMNFFVNADTKEVVYYYTIRAVNRGKFAYGPIGADAMYDAAIHSYAGGGMLTIN